jgi:hypothetical protein
MNPLLWKREHKIALAFAACLGFVLGFLISFSEIEPGSHWTLEYIKSNGGLGWQWIYRRLVIPPLWGAFGASVAAALVYIQRLLRA